MPGDDAADILLIRSHWLRARAREICGRGTYPLRQVLDFFVLENLQLMPYTSRIRIGTFNVNGKAPSQEIASWIRGSSDDEGSGDGASNPLPPLDRISPISLGDLARDGSGRSPILSSEAG